MMNRIDGAREDSIQELRRAMGTLPSESPEQRTEVRSLKDSLQVRAVSGPDNPYLAIFESAAATWGDDRYDLKWNRVSPDNRYRVCLAALTGNTLPQAIEVVSFLFQVRGTPRWLFEEHAREINQFITFLSVGCRDNNKLDASVITPSNPPGLESYCELAKENYRGIIEDGQQSWQSARSVLPMGYHHPYFFYTSYLALFMSCRKYFDNADHQELALLLRRCSDAVGARYPLLGRCLLGEKPTEDYHCEVRGRDIELFEADLEEDEL